MKTSFSRGELHMKMVLLVNSVTSYERNNINFTQTQKTEDKERSPNSFYETKTFITPKTDSMLQENKIIGQ